MSDTEEWNLEYYIRSAHKFTPAELTEAGEYYQNPKIMMALAQNLDSPAKALEILYRHTSEKEKASRSEAVTAQQLYLTIAANPNASPDLLLKMLRNGNSGQRAAALRSGNLPSKQKMEYLEKSCTLTDEPEMLAVAEDADTPLEVLECFSWLERCPFAVHCHGRSRSYFDKSPLSARDRFFDRALGKPAQKLCHPRRILNRFAF